MSLRPILLVENNPDDQLLTMRALRKQGIKNEVVLARDGVEALEYMFGNPSPAEVSAHKRPILVLLDLNLPRLSSHEVLRRLRQDPRTEQQIVVILSTSTESKDVDTCYRLGANSYIRKPVDFQEFTQVVGELNQYWLGINVPPTTND